MVSSSADVDESGDLVNYKVDVKIAFVIDAAPGDDTTTT